MATIYHHPLSIHNSYDLQKAELQDNLLVMAIKQGGSKSRNASTDMDPLLGSIASFTMTSVWIVLLQVKQCCHSLTYPHPLCVFKLRASHEVLKLLLYSLTEHVVPFE